MVTDLHDPRCTGPGNPRVLEHLSAYALPPGFLNQGEVGIVKSGKELRGLFGSGHIVTNVFGRDVGDEDPPLIGNVKLINVQPAANIFKLFAPLQHRGLQSDDLGEGPRLGQGGGVDNGTDRGDVFTVDDDLLAGILHLQPDETDGVALRLSALYGEGDAEGHDEGNHHEEEEPFLKGFTHIDAPYSRVRISLKPVTSKTSMTVSLTFLTTIPSSFDICFCAPSMTRSPALET